MRMISTRVEERGAFPLISPREKNASFNKSDNAKARRIQRIHPAKAAALMISVRLP